MLAIAAVSRTVAFSFVHTENTITHNVIVFPFDHSYQFAVLQSGLHYHWAWRYSSTLKQDLNYSPTDVFETFPFPDPAPEERDALDRIGEAYHEHRRQVMLARQEGLTATYNRFHDREETAEDIARLRELHMEMDRAVAAAYGWQDLDLGHGFHETAQGVRFTISEPARREVLARLLELNHERYAEEVRQGLHEKKGKKKTARKRVSRPVMAEDRQPRLF